VRQLTDPIGDGDGDVNDNVNDNVNERRAQTGTPELALRTPAMV